MCRIKVKVSELYEQVKLMKDDGMVYATLSIFEEEPDEDIPKALCLEACNATDPIDVGYDDLYNIE